MPRPGQTSITISSKKYKTIKRLAKEHDDLFDNPTDYVKKALTEYTIRIKTIPKEGK